MKHGYSESVTKTEMEKNKFRKRLVGTREGIIKEVPLVFTYLPLLKSVGTVLHKHLYLL